MSRAPVHRSGPRRRDRCRTSTGVRWSCWMKLTGGFAAATSQASVRAWRSCAPCCNARHGSELPPLYTRVMIAPEPPGTEAGSIVVALGGNALLPPGERGDIHQQFAHTRESLEPIVALAAAGWRIAIVHGNGPQIGDELQRNEAARAKLP